MCITLFCTFLCCQYKTATPKYGLSLRFVENVNTRQRLSFSFPELRYSLLELNRRRNLPTFDELKEFGWDKYDKVWSKSNSLFIMWRFGNHRRLCCLSSLYIAKLGRLIQDQSKVKGSNKMTKAPKKSSFYSFRFGQAKARYSSANVISTSLKKLFISRTDFTVLL